MKKLLEEITLLVDSPDTSSDSNLVVDLFHLLIWNIDWMKIGCAI